MTFKPMTYLVSFAIFVMVFMGLGGYVGYSKIADHFLAQAFLDSLPIQAQVQSDQQGNVVRWEGRVPLPQGAFAKISASNRALPIEIRFADEPTPGPAPSPKATDIPLAANERTEDLRLDSSGRYLYARVFATSPIKEKETTWLLRYDLQSRRVVRRATTNPILLPRPFRP